MRKKEVCMKRLFCQNSVEVVKTPIFCLHRFWKQCSYTTKKRIKINLKDLRIVFQKHQIWKKNSIENIRGNCLISILCIKNLIVKEMKKGFSGI